MHYTSETTLYLSLLIAIAAAALAHRRNRRLRHELEELATENQALELGNTDYRRSCIMTFWDWPAAWSGRRAALQDRMVNQAIEMFDATELVDRDYDQAVAAWEGYCPSCGTEDTGRYSTSAQQYCDDCLDTRELTWHLILRASVRSDGLTPSEYWICRQPDCGALLRYHEPDRGKFRCDKHDVGHWVLKSPGPYSQLSINQGWGWPIANPHKGLIAIPRFGSRDEILPPELRQVDAAEAIELYEEEQRSWNDEDSCFDRTYDAHTVYIPPLHGPCDATWVPAINLDFAPAAVADDDDIPF